MTRLALVNRGLGSSRNLRWAGVSVALASLCCTARHREAATVPAPPASAPPAIAPSAIAPPAIAPSDNPNVPSICREAHQQPGDLGGAPRGISATSTTWTAAATVRILSTAPFRVEPIGDRDGMSWDVPLQPTPGAAAKLAGMRFREVVTIHYVPPPILNRVEVDPVPVLDVEPATTAVAPVVVEWVPDDATAIRVYADGHVVVHRPDEPVTVMLTDAELRTFLSSFAVAGFDALPGDDGALGYGDVVLSCERRQRVRVAGHERALAPVLAALAELGARAAALESPVLFVEGPTPVRIVDWPADAPPLADLARLHDEAEAQARAGDYSSPVWQPLPRPLMAAIAQHRRETAPATQVLVRDHGRLRWLYDLGCQYGNPICRPDTYAAVGFNIPTIALAPAWAPDFSAIGSAGLVFDDARDARWLTLHDWYVQGDAMYRVTLKHLRRDQPRE